MSTSKYLNIYLYSCVIFLSTHDVDDENDDDTKYDYDYVFKAYKLLVNL